MALTVCVCVCLFTGYMVFAHRMPLGGKKAKVFKMGQPAAAFNSSTVQDQHRLLAHQPEMSPLLITAQSRTRLRIRKIND